MKMMSNNLILTVFMALFLLLNGCKSANDNTTTGNPFVSLAATSSASNATVSKTKPSLFDLFLPQAVAYPPPATLLDAVGNTVVIQAVWINFGEIEFKSEQVASGTEVDGDSVQFSGSNAIDLLSPTPMPFVSGPIN